MKATIRTFGKLIVLVNNAGYGNVAPIEDTTLEDFRAQIETNLFGVIILTKAVLPYFRERGSGHIIQGTSIAGRIGPIGRAPYAAAKWGVEGFSETLAKEVGRPRRQGHHRRTRWFPDGLRRVVNRAAGRTSRIRCDGG